MRSFIKALRDVAVIGGTIGATAGLLAFQNPEVLVGLAGLGLPGTLAMLLIPIAAKTAQDWLKHRNDPPQPSA